MVPGRMKLDKHEVTCVVTCRYKLREADGMSSSAIFLSPIHILAPGCLFGCSQLDLCDSNLPVDFSFEITMTREGSTKLKTVEALFITTWKCEKLAVVINNLFCSGDVQHCRSDAEREEVVAIDLIPQFILLQLPDTQGSALFLPHGLVDKLSQGTNLLACMTPFASSQAVNSFYNSWSSGMVSKELEKGVAFLSDVPCVPGGQGGIVYLNDSMAPVGIMIYPVIWKSQESTGLSVIGTLSAVTNSLCAHLKEKNIAPFHNLQHCKPSKIGRSFENQVIRSSRVVKVRNGHSWGSGILLSGMYVLTCGHVLTGHESDRIVVEADTKTCATVIFKSTAEETFDVAVLKLSDRLDGIRPLAYVPAAFVGSKIIAEGYGLFQRQNTTIQSSGVVAKVYSVNELSYLLATTCKVHPGSSGGAIKDESGKIIAMIIANTYDSTNRILYTGVSMAMSLHILYPSISKLCLSNDVSGFRLLEQTLGGVKVHLAMQSKL